MDSDPYSTPEAKVATPVQGPHRPVRGIVLALLFDFVGTTVAVAILAILLSTILSAQGLTGAEIASIVWSEDLYSWWNLFLTGIGLVFSYVSGRICIQVSRGDDFVYPGILAGIGAMLGFAMVASDIDIGHALAFSVLGAGFVLLGAKSELKARRGDPQPE